MRSRSVLVPAAVGLALALTACGSATKVDNQPATGVPTTATAGAGTSPMAESSGTAGEMSSDAAATDSAASGAGGSPAAFSCPSATDTFAFTSGGDVNIQNLWQQDLIPKFQQACPNITVKFTFDTHDANVNLNVSKLAAAVKSGQTPDVDVVDTGFATAAAQAGLTEKLSADKIPELGSVNADALAAYQGAAVPYRGSSVLLAYDSSQVASPPKTLADLLAWIKANPGKFTYNTPDSGGSGYSFAETVVASKMSADVVKKMQTDYVPDSEGEWSAGLDELKSLTPAIYQNVYPNGNQAVLDLLTKGEIAMAPVWSDQFLSAQSQGQLGEEFKVAQISDPSFTGGAAYIALIKGSKHADAGNAFISWLLQPAQQAEMITKISAFPAIPLSKLPADVQSSFAGVDTQDLRANFNSKLQADFKQKWAATVPG